MTSPAPDICKWCGDARPDHAEDCPVRKLAEGMARTMGAPRGTTTEFQIRIPLDEGD